MVPKCRSETCSEQATYNVPWLGDVVQFCEPCANKMRDTAEAMGMLVRISPIDDGGERFRAIIVREILPAAIEAAMDASIECENAQGCPHTGWPLPLTCGYGNEHKMDHDQWHIILEMGKRLDVTP